MRVLKSEATGKNVEVVDVGDDNTGVDVDKSEATTVIVDTGTSDSDRINVVDMFC